MTPEFPALYGMRLLAGRLLSEDRAEDASKLPVVRDVLINATAARRLGLSPVQAVGIRLRGLGDGTTVVGVLSDANLRGVQDALEPMIFWFAPSDGFKMTDLSVRIRMDRVAQTLSFIDRTWQQFQPGAAIQRRFVSQTFDDFFRAADREGTLLGCFVAIAIFIACLGLFGLAVFTAERRTKEIGVRKVVGARTSQIVWLMLWRISIPVLTANLLAWPLAYYLSASVARGLRVSGPPQSALLSGHRCSRATDRLGDGVCNHLAPGAHQSGTRAALRVRTLVLRIRDERRHVVVQLLQRRQRGHRPCARTRSSDTRCSPAASSAWAVAPSRTCPRRRASPGRSSRRSA